MCQTMSNSLMPQLANEILKQVQIQYETDQKFSDESLRTLHSFYGEVLVRALDLMEDGKFSLYQTPKGLRKLQTVNGKTEEYSFFTNINYCPCPAFRYQVLMSRRNITCKHILAAKLMQISQKITPEIITPEQMSDILKNQIPTNF